MKHVYSEQAVGECSQCHLPVTEGGYLVVDANGEVTGITCKHCKITEDNETSKTISLTVKKLQGSFMQFILKQELYHIISVKNILFKSDILTSKELEKYIQNPNVTVTIKH